jgi:hypothetical protein
MILFRFINSVMKKILFVIIVLLGFLLIKADAQYVRRKPGFSVNISIGAPGPAPYSGAIWVAPEWEWRGGRYVEVPGHWVRPARHGAIWINGGWAYSKRGYRWRRGHWK